MSHHMNLPVIASLLVIGVLGGCQSTPNHTNTLIFGTNTKFALDVSQDPTGVAGITLGYKRQEAVWMPLLANTQEIGGSSQGPADCIKSTAIETTTSSNGPVTTQRTDCKFSGKAGRESTNGAGAEDTYSVLATFSGQGSGVAGTGTATPGVSAGGSLAQFFATGLAARVLAEQGSSIVNTAGGSKVSSASTPKAQDAIATQISTEKSAINRVIFSVTDKNEKLVPSKLKELADKAAIQGNGVKERIISSTDTEDLRSFLTGNFESGAKPLYEAISQ